MSFLSGLIFGLSLTPAQFAPSDVPKNHWAYGAVNELFENGLLKGYPAEGRPLTLAKVPVDMTKARERLTRWDKEKLLKAYETSPPLTGSLRRPASNWEVAVGVHAAWANFAQGENLPVSDMLKKELPELADTISMFQYELTKLGADPKQMIDDLEKLRQQQEGRFQG